MNRRFVLPAIIFFAVMTALIWAVSCTGGQESDTGAQSSDDDPGRVIVPDGNWESAGSDDDETDDDDFDSPDSGTTPPAYSTVPGTNPPPSTGNGDEEDPTIPQENVTLEIFVDGIQHPVEMPIGVYDGQRVNCEFRLKSEGAGFSYFFINNSAVVSIPTEGDIFGNEATLPYSFTYVADTWGDAGHITLTVTLINRILYSWEIPVIQIGLDDGIIY